ncbi:MAG: pitrilysin family protein [Peptostreptococcus sp.]
MLSMGTMKYPTMRDISRRLDELYGMSMNVGVNKHGEKALTSFKFLSVSDKYLDEPIFEEVVDFINEIVSNPLVIDGKLNPDMFEVEKEILKDEINSKINDKRIYAAIRCIEAMCYDEPYSIDQVGYVEDLKSITPENMYEMYKEFIATSRIFITIEGDFDEEDAYKICRDKFKFDRGNIENIERERFDIVPHDPTYLTEIIGTNQGKLVIGYRTGVDYKDYEMYYSLMVGNSLFGGGPHSKLFNNVREKESICYYASSTLEKCKGLMIVSSGIEVNNYERALELITKELQDVINGNFSEEDVDNSKKSILNALKASYDSVSGESDFTYNQFISGTNLEIDEVINYVSNVDKESIVRSMANIFEDTVYYLR